MQFRTAVLLLVGAVANASAQTSAVDQAGWLAGCWEQRTATRVTVEMWMPPFGGVMLGASRTVINGRMREFEYIRLAARGDTLVYTASPSGQNTAEFKSTALSPQQLRFENRAHDFPQVVSYRRAGADSIVARVEGPGPNSSTRGIDFPMRRVSCTDVPAATIRPDTLLIDVDASRDAVRLPMPGAPRWTTARSSFSR